MREVISTKDAPQAIGPYSQAIKANGFVFVSGQVAIDPATQQVITGDAAAQTDRVLRNLSEILEAAGSGLGKVVRCDGLPEEHERLRRHERRSTASTSAQLRPRAPRSKSPGCPKMCWWKST